VSIHSIAPLLAVIILITSVAAFPTIAYAQQQQQQQQQQQVESANGGLIATLNGDSFTAGDTIIVNGTVEAQRQAGSYMTIEVIDPQGKIVEYGSPPVTADNTFIYRFIAGEQQQELDPNEPMITTGNYTMVVRYFPQPSDESVMEQVEFFFEYNAIEEGMTVGGTSTSDDYDADIQG
jgi:type II secretory pathway pseudopilin PulG